MADSKKPPPEETLLASHNLSPASAVSAPSPSYSPITGSINKMTPLPSPLASNESPGPWNTPGRAALSRNDTLERPYPPPHSRGNSVLITANGESLVTAITTQIQRKSLQLMGPSQSFPANGSPFKLNRESGSLAPPTSAPLFKSHERSPSLPAFDPRLHREQRLAQRRRTFSSAESSPLVPGNITPLTSVSGAEVSIDSGDLNQRLIKKQRLESFKAVSVTSGATGKWRGIRLIGEGAFSKVILATSEELPEEVDRVLGGGVIVDDESVALDPSKYVAVKIVERGAAGPDAKERVESSLKRELDILKAVHHPCLVRLLAYAIEPTRALLVLSYCAGGDLFDVASTFPLTTALIRRIFAETVSAVRYLHQHGIVHRDVKLENVLINLTRSQLSSIANSPYDYAHPISTLSDVGLSRRVDFERDELLTTRCGSDDYASPELIMGSPYDGRQTDAWALGVVLYALLEERLPFDPPEGGDIKMRRKTAHRIARCEWKWVKLVEKNDVKLETELLAGKRVVEGLLRRAPKRWTLDIVEADDWVKGAIAVEISNVQEG